MARLNEASVIAVAYDASTVKIVGGHCDKKIASPKMRPVAESRAMLIGSGAGREKTVGVGGAEPPGVNMGSRLSEAPWAKMKVAGG